MRTTFNVNDALLDELKKRASAEKKPLSKVINEVVQKGLTVPAIDRKEIQIPTAKVGINPPYQGMSLNQLYDQIESEDFLKVAEE